MAKQKKGEGFQSAAGLIRYFDAEESTALQISRWGVLITCLVIIVVVEATTAWGLTTGGYFLLGGVVLVLIVEWRIHRSESF